MDLPFGDPLVALFDGLPLTGHRLLDGRLDVDDPDGYEEAYQAGERRHGTAMASLICHGDLDEGGGPVTRPVYVRPVMKPHLDFGGQLVEAIPEDVLPIDLIHRAVRRLYETEGDESPAAPSVRVINLSVGDRSRPFDRGMSPWAGLLKDHQTRYLSSGRQAIPFRKIGHHASQRCFAGIWFQPSSGATCGDSRLIGGIGSNPSHKRHKQRGGPGIALDTLHLRRHQPGSLTARYESAFRI